MKLYRKISLLILFCFSTYSNEYILMDDETESFIEEIVCKIRNVLKYERNIKIYISSNQVLNAAAIQSGDILINAGAILQCSNVEELIAILAHEVGHISGNHITTYIASQIDFMKAGLVTMLIGATAAAIAGNTAPLAAGFFGGQSMAQGMAIGKLRQKENIADSKAAQAVKALKWPVWGGFVSIHEKLDSDSGIYNAYLSTHPQFKDRISKFRRFYEDDKGKIFPEENIKLLAKLQKKFEAIKTKIRALIWDCQTTLNYYSNPKNNNEKFAKAIAFYRFSQFEKAIPILDELIRYCDEDMDQAYYLEIKCMCLINIKQCKKAADISWEILKNDKKIKVHRDLAIIYADSIVEGNLNKIHISRAIKLLKKVIIANENEVSAINLLGKLYTMDGKMENASLCAAEFASIIGDSKMAVFHARKAMSSKNNVIKQKASDIISAENNMLPNSSAKER